MFFSHHQTQVQGNKNGKKKLWLYRKFSRPIRPAACSSVGKASVHAFQYGINSLQFRLRCQVLYFSTSNLKLSFDKNGEFPALWNHFYPIQIACLVQWKCLFSQNGGFGDKNSIFFHIFHPISTKLGRNTCIEVFHNPMIAFFDIYSLRGDIKKNHRIFCVLPKSWIFILLDGNSKKHHRSVGKGLY